MSTKSIAYNELTDEGKKLWDTIMAKGMLAKGKSTLPSKKKPEFNPYKIEGGLLKTELYFVRTQLRKLIENSKRVVRDCENIILSIKTQEEYLTCDAKIAQYIHSNLIIRLQNILNGLPALEHDI